MEADYYKILGVPPDADLKQIKTRYRFLCHAFHPDKFPPEQRAQAAEEFIPIDTAYQVLSREEKRAAYDSTRGYSSTSTNQREAKQHSASSSQSRPHPPKPPPPPPKPSFKCKAVKRLLLWSHLNCELSVSEKGLRFVDHSFNKHSFDIPFYTLMQATFPKHTFDSDLLVELPNGKKYDIGLDDGLKDQILDVIRRLKAG